MKEIKYRAWFKYAKRMCDVLAIDFSSKKVFIEADKKGIPRSYLYFDDSELIQYTGLKDKNDKEIYEGDIVEINSCKYFVEYEVGSFMLVRCSDKTVMYDQFDNCWNDDVYPLSQFYWDCDDEEDVLGNCEVIGNIYEKPELLEV